MVNKEMVVLARESRGLSQTELAEAIGVTQGKVSKYENGTLPVNAGDIENIALALNYSTDFFYQTDPIYGLGSSFIFHRKRKNVPVFVQRKIQAQVNILRMRIDRLLRSIDIEHENAFKYFDVDEFDGQIGKIAAGVRAIWKMPQGPISNVTALIESAGGIVVKVAFETKLIDAVHLWPPNMLPLFFVNCDLPGDRLRWTLAHEIGHAIMHQSSPTGDVEEQANAFTGEFLMPRAEIERHLHDLTLERAAILKPYWKVSMAAIIRRAKDLDCISERKYRTLNMSLSSQGYKAVEPFPVELEKPSLLDTIYQSHIDDLGYSQTELERRLFSRDSDRNAILPFEKPRPMLPFYDPQRIAN
jgi:Zn-dependent peptidase ImmA (M78 family)/transcriptional regulator with XRE-family HTH domain